MIRDRSADRPTNGSDRRGGSTESVEPGDPLATAGASPLRVLFLSPFAPRVDAVHGGSRTVARVMLGIAARNTVGLLYLRTEGEADVDDAVARRCDFITSVPIGFGRTRREWWARRARVVTALLNGRPRWVSNWTSASFAARLATAVEEWRPDIVQAEFHVMGQYLSASWGPGVSRVLVEHEPGVLVAEEAARSTKGLSRVLAAVELRAWRRYEAAVMRSADAVVALTDRDRDSLWPIAPDTIIETIPPGVELPEKPSNPIGATPPRLLFVGNFLHPPNVDAALHLVDRILPMVRQTIPECRLELVGVGPPAALRDHAGDNVRITGRVPDVQPYLETAAVVVVPLRRGGGMRVKVLEALAAGKAVVASTLAVDGLDVTDGQELRICDSDDAFVAAVVELLRAPQQRASLGARAREWAAQHLDPSITAKRYEKLYRSLRQGPRRATLDRRP